jgi:hypothetical protein
MRRLRRVLTLVILDHHFAGDDFARRRRGGRLSLGTRRGRLRLAGGNRYGGADHDEQREDDRGGSGHVVGTPVWFGKAGAIAFDPREVSEPYGPPFGGTTGRSSYRPPGPMA